MTKNTLQVQHKTFIFHFTGDSNKDFLQINGVVFLFFGTTSSAQLHFASF